jgi:hypothetical protein
VRDIFFLKDNQSAAGREKIAVCSMTWTPIAGVPEMAWRRIIPVTVKVLAITAAKMFLGKEVLA